MTTNLRVLKILVCEILINFDRVFILFSLKIYPFQNINLQIIIKKIFIIHSNLSNLQEKDVVTEMIISIEKKINELIINNMFDNENFMYIL
ncbi:hypothetical protein GCM10022217_06010 [Chryseobacterium ginsenosidimutans]